MSRLALFAMGAFLTAGVVAEWNFPLPNMYLSDAEGNQLEGTTASQSDRSLLKNFLNSPAECVHVRRPDGIWCKPAQETTPEPEPIEPEPEDPPVVDPDPAPPVVDSDTVVEDGQCTGYPFVYSRSKISKRPFTIKGIDVDEWGASNFDVQGLPDVSRFVSGMMEADLVYLDADCNQHVIENCTNDDARICAAINGRVSPDGTTIAYTLIEGDSFSSGLWTYKGVAPGKRIKVSTSEIAFYNILSQEKSRIPTRDSYSFGPAWKSNDEVVFSANDTKQQTVYCDGKDRVYPWAYQRYVSNLQGSDMKLIGVHDDVAMHPTFLKNGNMLFAQWRIDGRFCKDQGNGRVTLQNEFWVEECKQDGSNCITRLNAHGLSIANAAKPGSYDALLALHFYDEMTSGRLALANYYRTRHGTGGTISIIDPLPFGVEGAGDSLFPKQVNACPYCQEEDNPTKKVDGRYAGNMSYPAALPDDGLAVTYCSGYCFDGLAWENANWEHLQMLGANFGIYMFSKIPSSKPSDLIRIADSTNYHEFDGKPVLPYIAIHGQLTPTQQVAETVIDADGNERCKVEVLDVYRNELHRATQSKLGTKLYSDINLGRDISEVDRVVFYWAKPNTIKQVAQTAPVGGSDGHEIVRLGHAYPEADGSLSVYVPCDTSIKMRGEDAAGEEIVRDKIKHSLPIGTATRCVGCHGGHTENGYFEALGDHGSLEEAISKTIAAQKGPQELRID